MTDYRKFFKDKKITVMGLGILGRGLGIVKFLAECGADLIVTDLKPSTALRSSLKELQNYKNIKYVLGKHRLKDFRNRDMIIKSAGVPLNSIYIKEAKKHNPRLGGASTPVEMDVSLFAKLAPEVKIIGVTGTRGKSMTTMLIYEILKQNINFIKSPSTSLRTKKPSVFLGGNVRGVATLPLLKKINPSDDGGDILVCELDSWQLQGFRRRQGFGGQVGEAGFSPHIAVFTSFMPDHMNYYKGSVQKYFTDKANIFKYQKKEDFLITNKAVLKLIKNKPKSKIILANKKTVEDFRFIVPGEHQKQNLTYAVEVAKLFKIPEAKIKKAVKNFKGVEGRLQYVKTVKGVKIYNDNNATTPEATIAGIEALSNFRKSDFLKLRKIVLICGGADKKVPLDNFVKTIEKYCKAIVFIPGTGTNALLKKYKLKVPHKVGKNLNDIVPKAMKLAKRGDIVLFSPAFASFGMFNNEYERNDLFLKIIKKLK